MRRRYLPVAAGWLWAMIGLSSPAAADFSHFTIGPHVGWAHTTESKESGLTVGLATRFKVVEVLGAELAVDWRSEDLEAGEVNTVPVQLSGLIYVIPHYVHGTIGVGWYRVDASLEGVGDTLSDLDDSTSDAGLHLGAGFEVPLNSRMTFTGEGRYVFLGYELEDVDDVVEVDADFLNIIGGLQFYLW